MLRSAGYDLVIQPIGDAGAREEFFDELPVRGNADAVIVSSFAITPAEIRRLNTTRIPLIGHQHGLAGVHRLRAASTTRPASG